MGGEAKKRYARNSDGDAAIIESCDLCFRPLRLVVVAHGRSRWWQNWACERPDFLLGATAVVRCAMIYSGERGGRPGRQSFRFTFYRLGGGCR